MPRLGVFCVAVAGCATNIFIAAIAIYVVQRGSVRADSTLAAVLLVVARINIALGAFNLLPIPPLDGSKLLMSVLPTGAQQSLMRLQRYGWLVLMLLLFTGRLNPLIALIERFIYHVIGLLMIR